MEKSKWCRTFEYKLKLTGWWSLQVYDVIFGFLFCFVLAFCGRWEKNRNHFIIKQSYPPHTMYYILLRQHCSRHVWNICCLDITWTDTMELSKHSLQPKFSLQFSFNPWMQSERLACLSQFFSFSIFSSSSMQHNLTFEIRWWAQVLLESPWNLIHESWFIMSENVSIKAFCRYWLLDADAWRNAHQISHPFESTFVNRNSWHLHKT